MTFRFVHTADWQIGKPFGTFPAEVQVMLRDARLDAIDRIADLAAKTSAIHVLVGGDIYDSEGLSNETLRQPLERMRNHKRLTWHLLPGNHDPVRPGGVWDRVANMGPPENVCVYRTPDIVEIEPGVALLVAPLRGKFASEDPTAWMDTAETTPDTLRIGLAHGSIGRYGTDEHASVPIAADRAAKAGLHYLALGDDHGMKKINAQTWYSGTPEPDGWRQNDPGHALVVTLDGPGATPAVTCERVAKFAWAECEAGVDENGEIVGLANQIAALPARAQDCLIRLTLNGAATLAAGQVLNDQLEGLRGQLRHLEDDRTGVRQAAVPEDIAALGIGTELHKIGTRLIQSAESTNHSDGDADIAMMALTELIARAAAYEGKVNS